jgi:anti-sigma regulatory factor (Ser/Thr protein kinase)
MDIVELIEIALANSDERRVEVAALEPAEIKMEAVSGLAQILSELVENAIAFSDPDDRVRVTGLHEQGEYLISISDRGVGLPEHLMAELNRVLDDPNASTGPEPKLGIALVARLAARHDIDVRLVPGAPGTTARVTIPGRLAKEPTEAGHRLPPRSYEPADVFSHAGDADQPADLTRFDLGYRAGSGVIAMTEEAKAKAEAFLERVFAPLAKTPGITHRPEPSAPRESASPPPEQASGREAPTERPQGGTVTALRMRVPGENFSLVADEASTMAAERAIDIRTALSRYSEGRRSAQDAEEPSERPSEG